MRAAMKGIRPEAQGSILTKLSLEGINLCLKGGCSFIFKYIVCIFIWMICCVWHE